MPNERGFYTKEEVLATGLPYYIPASKRWTSTPYEFAVLLSKTRCKEFRMPVMGNGVIKEDGSGEYPSAFRYAAAAGTGTDDKTHRYIPLYDRTDVWKSGEISLDKLYEHEIMRKEDKT